MFSSTGTVVLPVEMFAMMMRAAVRHALGRSSYLPGEVSRMLVTYAEVFSKGDREDLAGEIERWCATWPDRPEASEWRHAASALREVGCGA